MKVSVIIIGLSLSIGAIQAQQLDVFGNKIPEKQTKLVTSPSSKINQRDAQGRKQGYWEKKYSNGNFAYKVTFKDESLLARW